MKATAELDNDLVRTAKKFVPDTNLSALLNDALRALIHMEASRRLATLEGSMPKLKKIKRTRADDL